MGFVDYNYCTCRNEVAIMESIESLNLIGNTTVTLSACRELLLYIRSQLLSIITLCSNTEYKIQRIWNQPALEKQDKLAKVKEWWIHSRKMDYPIAQGWIGRKTEKQKVWYKVGQSLKSLPVYMCYLIRNPQLNKIGVVTILLELSCYWNILVAR